MCGAFNGAIKEYGYGGQYRGVYPIKVNQNRTVVEEIIEFGRPFHYGLEAGSKPELLAIMAIHQDDESLIICNGYKDEEYIETALLASKMGKTVILVVEKPTELDQHPPRQRADEDQAVARHPRAPVVAWCRPLGAVRR